MNYKLTHFGLLCGDVEKSLFFYQHQLGSQLTYRAFNRGVNDTAFVGNGSDASLELVGAPFLPDEKEHIARHGFSVHHISFEVDEVDAAFADIQSRGVKVAWEPKDMDCTRRCGFYDADGLIFEVYSYPTATTIATPDLRKPWTLTELELHHISLLTSDLFRAERFYTENLGLKRVTHHITENNGGFIFMVDSLYNGKDHTCMLEIIGPTDSDEREVPLLRRRAPCFDHLCYVASDTRGAWQAAIDKGAKKFLEPVEEYGTCIAWVRDPDGNDVEIMRPFSEDQTETFLEGKESICLEK